MTLASNDRVSAIPVYIIISLSCSFILRTFFTTPSLPSFSSGARIPRPTATAWAPSAMAL